MVKATVPKPAPGDYTSIAAQYARAKALRDEEERRKAEKSNGVVDVREKEKTVSERLNEWKEERFKREWCWVVALLFLFLCIDGVVTYFFTSGFLLTRLVLEEKSSCTKPPIPPSFQGVGTREAGCWHPKTFDKAVVIIIDALRYDFTVPFDDTPQAFHNSLPFLYDTAIKEPQNAFLRPFIADPPTTTLQRLKGLTTGTLPTFIDAGSNFAGTAIDEDNILMQLRDAERRIVHLGDDTWTALFPGYFEEEISRAYDSLNVWDLHSLDNGVIEHIFPLLKEQEKKQMWDVMFAHFLGVDHAGHRYGPNHPAMTAKLQQMDAVLREIVENLDDETLLVVMGDHGMDGKGDHGGESDDEVEAALWMYSKKGIFGRTDPTFVAPPANAKIRPVNQIDLVPTLALLLGLPIPYNNLGGPIEEAFSGKKSSMWENLAAVSRMTAAGIKRYQAAYYEKRGVDESVLEGSPHALWEKAEQVLVASKGILSRDTYESLSAFQAEALRIFRAQWSRFNVPYMILGITIMAAKLVVLLLYINGNDDSSAVRNAELDRAERQLEMEYFMKGKPPIEEESSTKPLVLAVGLGTVIGAVAGLISGGAWTSEVNKDFAIAGGAIGGLGFMLTTRIRSMTYFSIPLPKTFWGWLAVIFTVSHSIGFASNSYTIWEDSILLYFLSTFGVAAAVSSMKLEKLADRSLAVYHSLLFVLLGWTASFSKLCREEQMPYCRSTYYSSATSSTSAPWQLVIPFILAIFLPLIIKSYYAGSRSYEGFAPFWIGWIFRFGLILNAIFWTLDAADDGEWFSNLPARRLKAVRVPIALTVFGLSLIAGSFAYYRATPCIAVTAATNSPSSTLYAVVNKQTVIILGYGNTYGALYMLFPISLLLSLLLVQKPMGAGSLSLLTLQAFSLLEILDLNSLITSASPIGPTILSLLASFHFFKTGHQHVLSTIQWETAFIPFYNLVYPWSPLLIVWNTFGAHILATSILPALVLWKREAKQRGSLMNSIGKQLAVYIAYWTTVALATMFWAGWLRRHLMLYRIFSPRFMGAVTGLLIVDLVGILVVLVGTRVVALSVGRIFGWG